jgi:hypothetical protein
MLTVSPRFAQIVSSIAAAVLLSAVCVGGAIAPAQSFAVSQLA